MNKNIISAESSAARSMSILTAVNAAATSIQRSARSEDDVLLAFKAQTLAFGLCGGLGLLDDTRRYATMRAVILPDDDLELLREYELQSGIVLGDLTFDISTVDAYEKVVVDRIPAFVPNFSTVVDQLMPQAAQEKSKPLLVKLIHKPAIFAPLIIEGDMFGVINFVGEDLRQEDVPAFAAYVNHIGIALEYARLITTVSEREKSYRQLAERLLIIREIDQAILTARSKEVIARVGLERLSGLIPFHRASVTMLDLRAKTGSVLAVFSRGETHITEGSSFRLDAEAEMFDALCAGDIYIERIIGNDPPSTEMGDQLHEEGIYQFVNVPLMSHGKLIGSMNIGLTTSEDFEEDQKEIATEVAGLLAVAIQDSQYLEAELRRRQEAETLISVAAELTSTLEMDQVLESILVHLGRVVPYDSACVFLIEGDQLQAVAGQGFPDLSKVIEETYSIEEELTSQVLTSNKPIVLQDAQQLSSFSQWGDTAYTKGWMGIPLLVRDSAIGLITLDNKSVGAYGSEEAELAQAVANQAATTIERARLFSESQRLLTRTRTQASQLKQLVDLVPDGIVLLDKNRSILIANEAATRYLAQLSDAQQGETLHQLGNVSMDNILQKGSASSNWQEISAIEPAGIFEVSSRSMDLSARDSDWLLMLRNVTDTRKQEGYIRAQERLTSVGQLAAGIAHDFNNIMTVISLYTQLVSRMPDLPEKEEKRLNTIQLQAERASELIRQILDFSRQSVVERKPVDLLPFARELVRTLSQTLPENIDFKTELPSREYLVNADTGRLQQAITNLAINARDAMPLGGELCIVMDYLTLDPEQRYPLPDMSAGEWIAITVSDTGEGITAEDLPRIFEPFFTTKHTGRGTGLGLAQVYGIVKLHEGFIDVVSDLNQGTTFTIYLPAFIAPADEEPRLEFDQIRTGLGETILLVEDDEASREALTEILGSVNYKVLAAANGQEALSIFDKKQGKVDLVISDMVMPIMDGARLYSALKERKSDIKMIIITGYPLERGGKEFLKQGVVAYIQKPLQVETVILAVRDALDNLGKDHFND